jgi:hypothetical protein
MTSKLEAANQILHTFAPDTTISPALSGGYQITFNGRNRRWRTNKGSDFPVFSWGHGGTATVALNHLIRWLQDKPVLPLSTWIYWSSETIKLCDADTVELLRKAGYPETAKCVLCGVQLKSFDWWSLDKVEGCCCLGNQGCREIVKISDVHFFRTSLILTISLLSS